MSSLRIDWLWVPLQLTNTSRVNEGICCVTIAEQPTLDVLRVTRVHFDTPKKQIDCVKIRQLGISIGSFHPQYLLNSIVRSMMPTASINLDNTCPSPQIDISRFFIPIISKYDVFEIRYKWAWNSRNRFCKMVGFNFRCNNCKISSYLNIVTLISKHWYYQWVRFHT